MKQPYPTSFTTESVCAILAKIKNKTRRPLNPQPTKTSKTFLDTDKTPGWAWKPLKPSSRMSLSMRKQIQAMIKRGLEPCWEEWTNEALTEQVLKPHCPYGQVGGLLYVKETYKIVPASAYRMSPGVVMTPNPDNPHEVAIYKAGWERSKPGSWKSPRFMPRWASRITLQITDLRVQRLRDISVNDCIREGVMDIIGKPQCWGEMTAIARGEHILTSWRILWARVYGTKKPELLWSANPFVYALTFDIVPQEEQIRRNAAFKRKPDETQNKTP